MVKRDFETIRGIILSCLRSGNKTINQIVTETGVNWRTVSKHLVYLSGMKYVEEVVKLKFVRIFTLTDEGRQFLEQKSEEQNLDQDSADELHDEIKREHLL